MASQSQSGKAPVVIDENTVLGDGGIVATQLDEVLDQMIADGAIAEVDAGSKLYHVWIQYASDSARERFIVDAYDLQNGHLGLRLVGSPKTWRYLPTSLLRNIEITDVSDEDDE